MSRVVRPMSANPAGEIQRGLGPVTSPGIMERAGCGQQLNRRRCKGRLPADRLQDWSSKPPPGDKLVPGTSGSQWPKARPWLLAPRRGNRAESSEIRHNSGAVPRASPEVAAVPGSAVKPPTPAAQLIWVAGGPRPAPRAKVNGAKSGPTRSHRRPWPHRRRQPRSASGLEVDGLLVVGHGEVYLRQRGDGD